LKLLGIEKRDLVLIVLSILSFSSSYPLTKMALSDVPPVALAAVRFLLAFLFTYPLLVHRYGPGGYSARALAYYFSIGFTSVYASMVLQNTGLQLTTASATSVLQTTIPVFTAILGVVFLGESLGLRMFFGVVASMTGAVLLATHGDLAHLGGSTFTGNALVLGSAVVVSISVLIGKTALREHRPFAVVVNSFWIGALLLMGTSLLTEPLDWVLHLGMNTVIVLLSLAVFPSCIGYILWYDVLERMEVSKIAHFGFLNPIFAIILSWLALEEVLEATDLLFSAIVVLGLILAVTEGRRK
jgi:O-acetylserine/cysteine efflux transporter